MGDNMTEHTANNELAKTVQENDKGLMNERKPLKFTTDHDSKGYGDTNDPSTWGIL